MPLQTEGSLALSMLAGLLTTIVAGCAVVVGWWLQLEYSAKLFAMCTRWQDTWPLRQPDV